MMKNIWMQSILAALLASSALSLGSLTLVHADTEEVKIKGTTGDDTITIDETTNTITASAGVTITVDEVACASPCTITGASSNQFKVEGRGSVTTDTIAIADGGGNDIYDIKAGSTITATVTDGAGNDNYKFRGDAGNDQVTYTDGAGSDKVNFEGKAGDDNFGATDSSSNNDKYQFQGGAGIGDTFTVSDATGDSGDKYDLKP